VDLLRISNSCSGDVLWMPIFRKGNGQADNNIDCASNTNEQLITRLQENNKTDTRVVCNIDIDTSYA